jgi:UDPglucose 6-dehydrogenase
MKRRQPRATTQPPKLGVVGAGYVGLVTAACLADKGHRVTVVEIDGPRLAALRTGKAPFHEPGLPALLERTLAAGTLRPTADATELADCQAVLVCVGTPLDQNGEADLEQVRSACQTIAIHAPDAVVVMRSTLPIGTAARLGSWLGRSDLDTVVLNPEFLRQGTAIADFRAPIRVVVGTHNGQANAAAELVARFHGSAAPLIVTDYATAEMIKNVANAFLATKLSFINEVADLCEAYGADIDAVRLGIGLDPRIGREYLQPGIGFGGSCLPKELSNLMQLGARRGLPVHLLHAASSENGGRALRTARRLDELVGGLAGRRVCLLGLSFKPDTDDVRYSPALALAEALLASGADVWAHDPAVPPERTSHVVGLRRARTVNEALAGAELTALATEWPEYLALDWAASRSLVARPLLFDGRNALDQAALRRQGWRVVRIGERADPRDFATAPARSTADVGAQARGSGWSASSTSRSAAARASGDRPLGRITRVRTRRLPRSLPRK